MPIAIDSCGEKVSALLNLGGRLGDQPFALIGKAMFGGKGEIFTQDRYIKFKANGGFSKLKKQETVNYSDVTELETFNSSTGLEWVLSGANGEFNAGMGNLFTREQKISDADEKFKRLSSIWYLRQIANLNFASKYLPEDETGVWPTKVVRPRAMTRSTGKIRTLSIKLPELSVFEEAIKSLEK